MELATRVNGLLTRLKVRARSGTLKETFIEVPSRRTWQMDMENTRKLMAVGIKESASMMSRKAMARKSGATVRSMWEGTTTA